MAERGAIASPGCSASHQLSHSRKAQCYLRDSMSNTTVSSIGVDLASLLWTCGDELAMERANEASGAARRGSVYMSVCVFDSLDRPPYVSDSSQTADRHGSPHYLQQ